VVDTTKPVCTLLGPTTVTREASFPYNAEAPVCKDNLDGLVKTVQTGSYDVEKATKYVLTYNAEDKSKNRAKTVYR
jgi:hypothetical protein